MSHNLDPELVPVMASLRARAAASPLPGRDDWKTLRKVGEAGQAYLAGLVPASAGVATTTYHVTTDDGAVLELRWYVKTEIADPGGQPAVVYAHGGGMVMGTLDLYDEVVGWYVDHTGVPFLAVGYRRAPDEAVGTRLTEDVFTGLRWLVDHAAELGLDRSRIAVMGDSGGGALAAGAAILARDRGVCLARQILIYPMLDDRNQEPGLEQAGYLTWSYDNNYTAWHAVLGDQLGSESVSPYAAPARLVDFTGLAPAYLDVGALDIFRDEGTSYAAKLALAGVPIELHVHPGVPHGWERFAPQSDCARRALADRVRAIRGLSSDRATTPAV